MIQNYVQLSAYQPDTRKGVYTSNQVLPGSTFGSLKPIGRRSNIKTLGSCLQASLIFSKSIQEFDSLLQQPTTLEGLHGTNSNIDLRIMIILVYEINNIFKEIIEERSIIK